MRPRSSISSHPTNRWHPSSATLLPAAVVHARVSHHAEFLADGRVLLTDGTGSDGSVVAEAEIFDPSTPYTVAPVTHARGVEHEIALLLAASLPVTGAVDVPSPHKR